LSRRTIARFIKNFEKSHRPLAALEALFNLALFLGGMRKKAKIFAKKQQRF
jgi:hypothetical protein